MKRDKKPPTFAFIGPPGAGKGTQAKFLARHFGFPILGTGDLLRHFAEQKSPIAQRLRRELLAGELVPSWLVFFLSMKKLFGMSLSRGVIFDGSPRKVVEAEFLDDVLFWLGRSEPVIIFLHISDAEARRRLLRRGRLDDRASAIDARLAAYHREVLPVIERYRKIGRICQIDSRATPVRVFQTIVSQIQKYGYQ